MFNATLVGPQKGGGALSAPIRVEVLLGIRDVEVVRGEFMRIPGIISGRFIRDGGVNRGE